ncbi:MAG: DMT family transporter [Bacteroidales bacterium]|jgi:drug/metabolite transporter (DMT)-like permease|nr:DMT family transporter [Bacteroidales bacterium]
MALNDKWFHLIALLTVFIWGITFVSTKILLHAGLSPEDIFFYRFLLAYVGIWFFGKQPLFSENIKDELVFLLIGISGGSLYFLSENFALKITLASNVSLIVCTAPILTTILSRIFLKNEKMHRQMIWGSIMALLGVALVVFNGNFVLKVHPLGDFLSLLAAFLWAVYTILLKRLGDRYSTLFITRKVFFYGLLSITPVFIFKPLMSDISVLSRPVVWGNLLFLGFVASLICYFLWNMSLKRLGAVRTTNYIYLIPLVTMIVSLIILEEKITWIALSGAAFILAGVSLAGKRGAN